MRVFDQKFKQDAGRYILQCGLATLTILAVLMFLDILAHTAIIAALGASSFIAFTMPRYDVSKPRLLLGGYLVGVSVGCLCSFISSLPGVAAAFPDGRDAAVVFGALSVGLAIFLMVITDTEHAPAASIALGLVLNDWDYRTIALILGGIVSISTLKHLLRPVMRNLL
jgi:CBS-domain-containing membrane protein